jgi:hypothetical protein
VPLQEKQIHIEFEDIKGWVTVTLGSTLPIPNFALPKDKKRTKEVRQVDLHLQSHSRYDQYGLFAHPDPKFRCLVKVDINTENPVAYELALCMVSLKLWQFISIAMRAVQ